MEHLQSVETSQNIFKLSYANLNPTIFVFVIFETGSHAVQVGFKHYVGEADLELEILLPLSSLLLGSMHVFLKEK